MNPDQHVLTMTLQQYKIYKRMQWLKQQSSSCELPDWMIRSPSAGKPWMVYTISFFDIFAQGRPKQNTDITIASSRFSAILYVQNLTSILFPTPLLIEREILLVRQQESLLAPRERWESNVSEIQAPAWLSRSPRPILWIGGRQNRRGVSWVSSFTLDLVEALKMERTVQVLYTLCNSGKDGVPASPLSVFKRLAVELLKAYPEIVLVPENLDKLSVQKFQAVGESPEAAYKILADILKIVDIQCQRDRKELFLLIDRVDVMLTRENVAGRQRFLRALLQLNAEYKNLRLVLTSQHPVVELEVGAEGKDSLMEIWVDTTKPLAMHSRQ